MPCAGTEPVHHHRNEGRGAAQRQERKGKVDRDTGESGRDFRTRNTPGIRPPQGLSAEKQVGNDVEILSRSRWISPRPSHGFASREDKLGGLSDRDFSATDGVYQDDRANQLDATGHTSATALPSPSYSRSRAKSAGRRLGEDPSPSSRGLGLSKVLVVARKAADTGGDVYGNGRADFGAEPEDFGGWDRDIAREVRLCMSQA